MTDKPVVVVTNWVHDAVLERLGEQFEVIANREREPWPEATLHAHLQRADALIAFMPDMIDERVLQRAPRLRMVSCCLKGFDNFDIEACSRRGVLVTILPDLLTEPGAELAIGMMIAAGRHVLAADAYVRSGAFQGWRPKFYGTGLADSTVGLVGFGAVGKSIAERLKPFRTHTLYWDRQRLDEGAEHQLGVSYSDLDDLLSSSDFVILALSLTPQTRHIIDARKIAQMKPGTILINFARGSLVDEAAVAQSLQEGHLGFFAADVFEFEDWVIADRPREIHPAILAQSERTLLTPHLGSATTRVRQDMAMQAAESVIEYLGGTIPDSALNAEAVLGSRTVAADA